ncbi:hypothetical protein [Hanstruepera flava]|uniref:hypothetical protein n=1 Tax=Hanstruepera flava TaxID=2930218 RepID=UPI0020286F03|nr:hypothetical protein [Hanstruepera flava]
MKKVLFLLIVLPHLLFSQSKNDNADQEVEQTFFHKPQFYFYISHHINKGEHFLADGHKPDFFGGGIQINFIKYHNVKFGLGWEYHEYNVTDKSTIGNINSSFYHAAFAKFQYQWDILKRWSIEPYLGLGATRIQQRYINSARDDFYGMNFYAGGNFTFKLTKYLSVFTGINYNNIRFNINTNSNWKDYFNKVNQIQMQFGIILTVDGNKGL